MSEEEDRELTLLMEEVLDTLVETGNGVTGEHLTVACNQMFRVRDLVGALREDLDNLRQCHRELEDALREQAEDLTMMRHEAASAAAGEAGLRHTLEQVRYLCQTHLEDEVEINE